MKYSIDFVIVIECDDGEYIIRSDKHSEPRRYFWNELPSRSSEKYRYFKGLDPQGKKEIIDKVIIEKCKNKRNPDPDKSSSEILLEEINKYEQRHRVHR